MRGIFLNNFLEKFLFTRFLSSMIICPHCGAELKKGATFCPHCGSDKNTGWKEGAEYSDLDLPDYDEIVENEFGDNPDMRIKIMAKGMAKARNRAPIRIMRFLGLTLPS